MKAELVEKQGHLSDKTYYAIRIKDSKLDPHEWKFKEGFVLRLTDFAYYEIDCPKEFLQEIVDKINS